MDPVRGSACLVFHAFSFINTHVRPERGYSLSGKLHSKGVQCTFFRLQVYERVGISRVDVCERVGKYRYFEGA